MAEPDKGYRGGTHRACAPEVTWERIRPLLPAMGITRIADVTGLDRVGIPVAMAVRPNARSLSVSQGKGATWAEARVSGAMEAIETWHAERAAPPGQTASFEALGGVATALDPRWLSLRPGAPYHDRLALGWVEGVDLISGRPCWTPRELVTLDMLVSPTPGASCFAVTTSGLASGNTRTEARLHALYELVERDATSLWRCRELLGRHGETKVDPDSVDHPLARRALERLRAAGLEVAIFDETTDLDVPSYGVRVFEREPEAWDHPLGSAGGAGCHLDPGVALLRALTEAAQSRLTFIAGSRDDLAWRHYLDPAPLRRSLTSGLPPEYALPPRRDFRERRSDATDSLERDLERVLERLLARGIDRVVAVDLDRDDIGVPVSRLVARDLEHLGDHASLRRIGVRARRVLGR